MITTSSSPKIVVWRAGLNPVPVPANEAFSAIAVPVELNDPSRCIVTILAWPPFHTHITVGWNTQQGFFFPPVGLRLQAPGMSSRYIWWKANTPFSCFTL